MHEARLGQTWFTSSSASADLNLFIASPAPSQGLPFGPQMTLSPQWCESNMFSEDSTLHTLTSTFPQPSAMQQPSGISWLQGFGHDHGS